ncbi:MAG: PD-(D/E)XK nuclease family protein [Candidatus Roizmanbacteria bacterium]|nr:PD-(D/E)XK nuclease family protein [Candidatus Roizmanbacteria bacterium]
MGNDDTYSALWVSYSTLNDFLTCPRAYYLKNIYRYPQSGNKIALMTPALALGQAVHEVIRALSAIPSSNRFQQSPILLLDKQWEKIAGKMGGFHSQKHEDIYKKRGEDMMRRLLNNPGPLAHLTLRLKKELLSFWLSKEEQIILCGKIDWLEYIQKHDSVHIIDFKTSRGSEEEGSLQLPIYYLLARAVQKRNIDGVSYWYLDRNNSPTPMDLPDEKSAKETVLSLAKDVKLAKQLNRFICKHGGCQACRPYEKIALGGAECIGTNDYKRDVFILPDDNKDSLVSTDTETDEQLL